MQAPRQLTGIGQDGLHPRTARLHGLHDSATHGAHGPHINDKSPPVLVVWLNEDETASRRLFKVGRIDCMLGGESRITSDALF